VPLRTPALLATYALLLRYESQGRPILPAFSAALPKVHPFGTSQEGGNEVPITSTNHIDSSISQILVGYNVTDRFGVQFNLPLIYRESGDPMEP